jgi:CheY-like chemotaxis protein
MPDGGIINVVCRNVQVTKEGNLPLKAGCYILVSIMDHGVGIPPESLERIFDPYFTTKKSGKGLGLATVYSIIKNHEGHITVTSQPGEGTTFSFYLPCADAGEVAQEKESATIKVTDSTPFSGKILVMDDEENIRDVAGEMLNFLGYDVEFAVDGAEAVKHYRECLDSKEPFTAVLMDLTVPGGMGGKEAMNQLRELDREVKVIASSGYSNDPIMADFRTYGFRGIISKPYQLNELKKVLEQVLVNE